MAANAIRLAPARLAALGRFLTLLFLTFLVAGRPLLAQDGDPQILRDTETEQFLADISAPLAKSAGLAPGALKVVLINDPEINAFVAGGQTIYINSGLILAADNANEVEGVIAHELGHIEAGHIPLQGEGLRPASRIALLSLLLGVAAIAAGAAGPGMAALGAGTQVAQSKALAFTRGQEGSADASAVRHLNEAHYSGKGMVSFFAKLKQEEYRLTPADATIDPYAQTHPMTDDREAALTADLQKSPWWNAMPDPAQQARFLRVKAKLAGYVQDPDVTLRKMPESDQTIPAHYARAYAWHRAAYPDKANQEADALLATAPLDPYFNELKGQILLENGHPKEALAPLRIAVAQSHGAPLISALFGQALIATDDPANFAEAEKVLKVSVDKDREDPLAWYALGAVYAQRGDEAHAALASAEKYAMDGNDQLARTNAEKALLGLKQGTPDYLRAEDIAVTSRNNMDSRYGKKR
ncbi:M48 family metalloprotease [Sphingomonas oryzagri]|uniref:M48 family metalloprotease n=1 Tax=Sphingomonas oryzagri TaxID=3042314 RepID=A0ABT6N6V3_9SPHN|nr:M48 family metalloprotease [Sphingomonas oryzagri]MDH7640810.1 M48 family metalloprotease [Sphingomonas oryzagri]